MLTLLLAVVDAFSEERFELLYIFLLYMDWYIIDNVILPLVRSKEKK